MKYNFDEVTNRKDTNSVKWDRIEEITGLEADSLPLWIADMDFKCAKPIVDAIKKCADNEIYGYSSMGNDYYNSVINWMKERHNLDVSKESICITPGIFKALGFIIQSFTNEGEGVIVQTPVYGPFMNVINKNNRKVYENKLIYKDNEYKIDFDNLEEIAKDDDVKLLFLCNPHNPISKVWTKEELTKIGKICTKHGVIIVSDEIHADIIYKGYKHIPIASISKEFENNTITCTSPGKTFNITGLEISNIIIPNGDMRSKFKDALDKVGIKGSNPFAIVATTAAYESCGDWLDELLIYLEANVELVKSFIKEHLPKIKIAKVEGTFLLWLDFSEYNLSSDELREILEKKAKLAINRGEAFGEPSGNFRRLNIGCQRALLETALNRLKEVLEI